MFSESVHLSRIRFPSEKRYNKASFAILGNMENIQFSLSKLLTFISPARLIILVFLMGTVLRGESLAVLARWMIVQ